MPLPKGVTLNKSGRYRARFMHNGKAYTAVWDTPRQAEQWIARTRRDLALGIHDDAPATDPATGKPAAPLLRDYAPQWLERRRIKGRPLKHGTKVLYGRLIEQELVPVFGGRRLDAITAAMVRDWHRALHPDEPTARAHTYSLLRTILNTAVEEELITANPCRVKGAGQVERASRTEVPTVEQVERLIACMPGPKYKNACRIAAWCGLRMGELTELRRKDVVVDDAGRPVALRVRRAIYRGHVDTPKSHAGARTVSLPPHIRADFADYLATRPAPAEALIFAGTRTGAQLPAGSIRTVLYEARAKAGLPDLRWHDLRHFSATVAAMTGASLAELQARLGHSTVNAALRYQHAAEGRDAAIADAMSALRRNGGTVGEP